jgi:uncharacterized protein
MTATARLLPGNRLHLQHGPIDLIIGADGTPENVERAYRAAWAAFPDILPALVSQLPFLRTPVVGALPLSPATPGERAEAGPYGHRRVSVDIPAEGEGRLLVRTSMHSANLSGEATTEQVAAPHPNPLPRRGGGQGTRSVADRMYAAVWPYRDRFITPMAAVAGSVADHVLRLMLAAAPLRRAYVNNGGDIAIHLAPGATFTAGVVGDLAAPAIDARVFINAGDGIGGIATSGWRGRSQSLGIADSVTVLAATAATADAAATMIANAVDVDDPAIARRPACEVKDDSDLGCLLVTVGVGRLTPEARSRAIAGGVARALEILEHKRIIAAYIQLQGEMVVVGTKAQRLEAA